MSAPDAVDGSSTGTRVPSMWVLLGRPLLEEPDYANDHDYRSRYREVSVSGSWRRCRWQCSCSPSAQATICSDVLSEAAAVPGWHRGMRVIALLVARTSGARSHRAPDVAGLRQALRQTTEERCG